MAEETLPKTPEGMTPKETLQYAAIHIAAGMCAMSGPESWETRWGGVAACSVKMAKEILSTIELETSQWPKK